MTCKRVQKVNVAMDYPTQQFLLFGMGASRRKLLYIRGGRLLDALTLEPIHEWQVAHETIDAAEYRVVVHARDGRASTVVEDEDGVWLEQNGDRRSLTQGQRVHLPRFEGHPYAPWLRALHGELLVHVLPAGPVPNLWVYPRPWYRDAAMVLLCLEETGNLTLVEPWVMGLHKVWDRNNAGVPEADNLGQVLFMLSRFTDRHPLIHRVLDAVPSYHRDGYIVGQTDGAERPVYQTKWLKYGLRSLGLDDPYRIPELYDAYSALFWMDYRHAHVEAPRFSAQSLAHYPYLNWAEAHFYDDPPPEPLIDLQSPLTREARASQADYWRLRVLADVGAIPAEHVENRVCTPHTWHAAEMFLYLIERDRQAGTEEACT